MHVVEKRTDGFHNIETIFYPIGWSDILEIVPANKFQFKKTGIRIAGGETKNLCIKAYNLLKENYNIPPVKIHLHKIIPIGAGLGGGSSDAAFTLILLNNLFNLKLPDSELAALASQLGSDCSFFIHNKPVYATGRGEQFEPIPLSLKGYSLLVIKPDVNVSTANAYQQLTPKPSLMDLRGITQKPVSEWKNFLTNDFEPFMNKKHPVIGYIKEELYAHDALYASMSGSGSSVFGIFDNHQSLDIVKKKMKDYKSWSGVLY